MQNQRTAAVPEIDSTFTSKVKAIPNIESRALEIEST